MQPWDWYLKVIRQYVDFSGRARRKEYWFFTLFTTLITLALLCVDALVLGYRFEPGHFGILANLYGLALLLPSLAVVVRRLHDTNRSGWWILFNLVPLVGPITILVFMCLDSTPGANRFGPNPKVVPFKV